MRKSMIVGVLTANLAVLSGCSDGQSSKGGATSSGSTFEVVDQQNNSSDGGGAATPVKPEPDVTVPAVPQAVRVELTEQERASLAERFKSTSAPHLLIMPRIQQFDAAADRGYLALDFDSRLVVFGDNNELFSSLDKTLGWPHKLRQLTGLALPLVQTTDVLPNDIVLRSGGSEKLKDSESLIYKWRRNLSKGVSAEVAREGYELDIKADGVDVTFNTNVGAVRALETIAQLLLLDGRPTSQHLALPIGKALDYPNFGYRAVMIDVARQFVSKKDLIGLMEVMSLAKLNTLHLHLSDNVDPIDHANGANGYIRLWDPSLPADIIALKPKDVGPDGRGGLYYTRADIAELERVADSYGIEIVGEIDVPGHSRAFTDLYPEFRKPGVTSGSELNSLDVNNPKVLPFIAKALVEYASFFKSKKFHVGGDEAFGTVRPDWARFMDDLAAELKKANVGSDRLFHWSNHGNKVETSSDYTIYSWQTVNQENLNGHAYVDASTVRYVVPYALPQTYPAIQPPERAPGSAELMWNVAGLPIGGALTVWNDLGERYNYGYEIMNTGIKFMMTPMGYTYWNGIMLKPNGNDKIEYVDHKTGFPNVAYEFNSTWILDRFPYLAGQQAVNLVIDSASWRTYSDGQYISRRTDNDPLGYDPIDLASAYKGPLYIRDGEDFVVDMPGEGKPFITRPNAVCKDPEHAKNRLRISRCDQDTWRNDLSNAKGAAGTGKLRKVGPGKLTLTGYNRYTGPTLVEGGTLVVKHLMPSQVTVSEGATYVGPEQSSGVMHF